MPRKPVGNSAVFHLSVVLKRTKLISRKSNCHIFKQTKWDFLPLFSDDLVRLFQSAQVASELYQTKLISRPPRVSAFCFPNQSPEILTTEEERNEVSSVCDHFLWNKVTMFFLLLFFFFWRGKERKCWRCKLFSERRFLKEKQLLSCAARTSKDQVSSKLNFFLMEYFIDWNIYYVMTFHRPARLNGGSRGFPLLCFLTKRFLFSATQLYLKFFSV